MLELLLFLLLLHTDRLPDPLFKQLRYGFALTNTSISSFLFTCWLFQHNARPNTNTLSYATNKRTRNWIAHVASCFVCIELVYLPVYVSVCVCVYMCFTTALFTISDRIVRWTYSYRLHVRNFQSVIIFYPKWYVTISTLLCIRANR